MPQTTPVSEIETLTQAVGFLNQLDVSAMKLGLDRVQKLLETMDNPQDSLPMVHIAGTNGKGSVTAMLTSILKAAGLKVGSFTSPHLIQVRERIGINGNPILPDDFQHEVQSLKHHLETLGWPREDWPTYFEFLNVMAYRFFKQKRVDITVFETGLGGRLDSTNVVRQPNLSVITTIGKDHMQHLGHTLAAIAGEKAGIIKNAVPVVLGGRLDETALAVILEKAALHEAPVIMAQPDRLSVSPQSNPTEGLLVTDAESGSTYRLSLLGPYQIDNLAIVLACVHQLRQQGFAIPQAAVEEGLRRVYWPVRFQYFATQHLVLDGSHNEDGFRTLADTLRLYFPEEPTLWLVSLRNNRPPEALLDVLRQFPPPLGMVVTQASPEHLYHPPQVLMDLLQRLFPDCPIEKALTPTAGCERLMQLRDQWATEARPLCLVTGSLYTAGEILGNLEKV
ncbi:folylpolyglutamate synthase/dihydrofolate synthase family protein [Vampirovibrio sp.]|uniref:bifunctional folylpolyglutamate synthase/dihydrofolate synthase n=1 Tax=Vampirovibrio sp. TaxID=2717857 RepID=UPI0035931979